jgi:uncharacterized RDD family membrane protein YckC
MPPPPSAPPPPPGPPPTGFTPPPTWQQSSVGHAALGSRATRFGAALIDGFVIVIPLVVVVIAVGDSDAGSALTGILYLAALALYSPLLMMREGANNGQTLGKQVTGLRVVHQSGEPMTLANGLLRDAVGRSLINLVTCGLYGIIDALWCLWDPRKQCLHDKIGSTFVFEASADPRVATTLSS